MKCLMNGVIDMFSSSGQGVYRARKARNDEKGTNLENELEKTKKAQNLAKNTKF